MRREGGEEEVEKAVAKEGSEDGADVSRQKIHEGEQQQNQQN